MGYHPAMPPVNNVIWAIVGVLLIIVLFLWLAARF
jgi:hypothetical protein